MFNDRKKADDNSLYRPRRDPRNRAREAALLLVPECELYLPKIRQKTAEQSEEAARRAVSRALFQKCFA